MKDLFPLKKKKIELLQSFRTSVHVCDVEYRSGFLPELDKVKK